MTFNVDDRVVYTSGNFGNETYNPLFDPDDPVVGTVIEIEANTWDDEPWYFVEWDNGTSNQYHAEDLSYHHDAAPPVYDTPSAKPTGTLEWIMDTLELTLPFKRVHDMIDRSCPELGNGYYAKVYKCCTVAVKVGGAFSRPDLGGQLWAKWCLEHQHLEAVPKVYKYKEFGNGRYMVVMELLQKHSYSGAWQLNAEYITEIGTRYEREPLGIPQYIQDFAQEFKSIRAAGCMDLHMGNYMQRPSTKRMVIIDPFSGTNER